MWLNLHHGGLTGPVPIKVGSRVVTIQWYDNGMDMLDTVLRFLRLPIIRAGVELDAYNEVRKGEPIVFDLVPIGRFAGKPLEAVIPRWWHSAGFPVGEPIVELKIIKPPGLDIDKFFENRSM
jgi:hypothetical protein